MEVNTLWSNDTISQHRSGSTLAQVMACCLMAPSHYLNQCGLFITNIRSCDIHLKAISEKIPQPSIITVSLKFTCDVVPWSCVILLWPSNMYFPFLYITAWLELLKGCPAGFPGSPGWYHDWWVILDKYVLINKKSLQMKLQFQWYIP